MTKISIPVNNLIEGENSLYIWCADNSPGIITSIRVVASEEAGLVRDAFNPEGGLAGFALSDSQVTAYNSAEVSTSYIIADMESNSKLSPSEKATWRISWVEIEANYIKAVDFATTLPVSTGGIFDSFTLLTGILTTAGVWSKPKTTYILSGSEISEAVIAYSTAYRELSIATTNKVAADAEEAANGHTDDFVDNTYVPDQKLITDELFTFSSDSMIVPFEKEQILITWNTLVADHNELIDSASSYSLSLGSIIISAYTTAYDTLFNYIDSSKSGSILYSMSTTSEIVRSTFNANFDNYFGCRTDFAEEVANGLQGGIDTKIITWFQSIDPDGTSAWIESGSDISHTGDIWWNDSDGDGKGELKRWLGYAWGATIVDPVANLAFDNAGIAQDTADNKRRVFTTEPRGPYDEGDLWDIITGIKVCTTSRDTFNAYTSSDWQLRGDVTGDNTSDNTDFVGTVASGVVIEDLGIAKDDASTALTAVLTMEDDGILSASEKTTWRANWPGMEANYNSLIVYADSLSVSYSTLSMAKLFLHQYLETAGVWSFNVEPYTIVGTALSTVTSNYYESFQDIINDCADKVSANAKVAAIDNILSMGDDDILSPEEKSYWRRLWPTIVANYSEYVSKSSRLNVSVANVNNAYVALNTYLVYTAGIDSNILESTIISGDTFKLKVATYYNAVEKFLELCDIADNEDAVNTTKNWANDTFDPDADNTQTVLTNGAEIKNAKVNGQAFIDGSYIRAGLMHTDILWVGEADLTKNSMSMGTDVPAYGSYAKSPTSYSSRGAGVYTERAEQSVLGVNADSYWGILKTSVIFDSTTVLNGANVIQQFYVGENLYKRFSNYPYNSWTAWTTVKDGADGTQDALNTGAVLNSAVILDAQLNGRTVAIGGYLNTAVLEAGFITAGSAFLGTACVETLKIGENAVSVPESKNITTNTITGNGGYQAAIDVTITNSSSVEMAIVGLFSARIGYLGSTVTTGYRVKWGTAIFRDFGTIAAINDFPSLQFGDKVGANSSAKFTVEWYAANSNVNMTQRSLTVWGVKR